MIMDRMATNGQMIDQIDLRGVPHSGFDRSNHNYGTGKLGALIPVRLDEVYPGDRIKGNPEMVVNFEPLAAPLMGSMVLKQESFFVPYIQLWRHAYKFFTGKNGFDEDMPTISPRDIFDIYWENIYEPMFNIGNADTSIFGLLWDNLAVYHGIVTTSPQNRYSESASETDQTFFEQYKSCLTDVEAIIRNVFGTRKMTDLVTPAFDIFRNFLDSDELIRFSEILEDTSASTTTKQNAMYSFAGTFGQLITDFFQFFHGPSSLFDYLGWPVVPNFDSDIKIPQYGIYNRIQYCLYYALRFWQSPEANLYNLLRGYFSLMPLVFNPFKAYYLIWYWYYRDQLLETGILDPDEDEFLGSDITGNVVLYCTVMRQRCWFKDTFTTALTNTGDANLMVPAVSGIDSDISYSYYDDNGQFFNTTDAASAFQSGATVMRVSSGSLEYKVPMNYLVGAHDNNAFSSLDANFISLDLFDRIKRLRSFLQKKLILGYEVDDVVYSSFLVTMSHVRMHIPEILGRGRDAVQINTIVNNTSTDQQIAGDKTATAWAHGKQSQMNYFSEEWGLFLTFTTIMPIQSYAGGMQRLYLKKDVFDYMWPDFATMGMDAVYNAELAAVGTRLTDEQATMVFGYQGRYYDLKSRLDEEHGRLLTDLNFLTFSREWDKNNPPKLNYIFVHCWPRLDGFVISSPLVDVFRYDCYNAHAWERRLPVPSEIIS